MYHPRNIKSVPNALFTSEVMNNALGTFVTVEEVCFFYSALFVEEENK